MNRQGQVTVRTNRYSVPLRLIGRQVRVQLHANDLEIYHGRELVARHDRLGTRAGSRLELDHYLEALIRKPGALPGATVLEQARASGKFTPVHDAWWAAARKAHGDAAGTRALIGVLLHRHMPSDHVVAGIAAALRAGALTADAVALEAQPSASPQQGPARLRLRPQSPRRPAMIHTLASCEWVSKDEPLCLIGDSGTGKSRLLIALGTEAAMAGHSIRYVPAAKLVSELVEAADDKMLPETIARYGRVDLLCIDLCRHRDYA
ncbi:Mobile element protein [[Actinomadura] parvosata subsp. kistnae]|nr:Mobile element protein [Actinomadura parvosata subsp. kistnae]